METKKIFNFLTRVIAVIILFFVVYILAIFFFPAYADEYGNKEFNEMVRHIKFRADSLYSSDGTFQSPF